MQNIEQRIASVRDDREHGSRWLVRQALLILRDLALMEGYGSDAHMRQLYHSGRTLARSRPAMAALSSAVSRVLFERSGPADIAAAAEQLLQEYDTATTRIARHARPYLRDRLLTCSISGTVLEVLVSAREAIQEVIVLEGRPRYEGRDMAHALSQYGIAVTLITDAQAAIFLPLCQSIVVGADSVLANGDILNKAGTALLAWAGHGLHIPLYVLCESLKIAAQSWPEEWGEALLEEKEPGEVLEHPLPGVKVRNFYFDHTPARLVNGLITEQGILRTQDIQTIAATVKVQEHFLNGRYP
ncbi:MAG: hypothetical protein J2P37_02045 [Ktedonobacteraceae bacterium]|nr:hypothetical protein [Ktedonobacteraceae bacterium]